MANENKRRKAIERTLSGYPFPDFMKLSIFGHPDYDTEMFYAMNFANYTYDHAELRKYTEEYSISHDISANISKVPDWEFYHVGIMAWLHVKGAQLSKDQHDYISKKLHSLEVKYNVEAKTVKTRDIKSVRTDNLIAELEGLLDDVVLGKQLTQPLETIRNAGVIDHDRVKDHFQKQSEELTDPNNSEYFVHDARKILMAIKIILTDLNKSVGMKPVRKARVAKPKKVNPSKMVKSLKYLKEDAENGLKSINPESIVGSEILWVFNVKTRKIGKYIAKDGSKLMIKGSTVLNYDENQSLMKIVRKPKEVIPKVMTSGKVDQRKILDGIRAVDQKLSGRINKDTILMRVF